MRWHHRLYVILRGLFRSASIDRELNEELRFHFDRQVEENLTAGMTPTEARRSAAIKIGNPEPIREAARDGRAGVWIRQFGRDVSHGCRLLTKAPAFAISALLIVALGIGSVTAIFSVVYGVLLRPLPFPEPERLVQIWTRSPRYARDAVSAADRRDWVANTTAFEGIALYNAYANFNLTDGTGDPERLLAARISANSFSVLQVWPRLGRAFLPGEDEGDGARVVILGDALWQRRFGADPGIIGRSIQVSGVPHEVVGVMGPDFPFPERPFDLWVPLTVNPKELSREIPGFGLRSIARLKPGVSRREAESQLNVVAARLAQQYPMNKDISVEVVGMRDSLVGDVRLALYLMLGAVAALLSVATLNLAALLSSRAIARSREIALRLALGASRTRVLLQSVAEVMPLLIAGGVIGIAAASVAVRWFVPIAPIALPRIDGIAIDRGVLLMAILVLSATGIAAAVLPALQAWRTDLAMASRDASRGSSAGPRQARARTALVMTQIALSLPLTIGALMLARSFSSVAAIDPGFDPNHVVSMHLAIPRSKYRSDSQIAQFEGRLLDRIQQVPGVESAAFVNRLPLFGVAQNVVVEFEQHAGEMLYGRRVIAPDYFKTMKIPIVEGRAFGSGDTVTAPAVAIVDERIARRHWPGRNPLGQRLRFPARGSIPPSPWIEIVGVVGHVRHDGLDAESIGQVYFDYRQMTQDRAVVVARVSGDEARAMAGMKAAIRELDPEQPAYDARTMEDVLARSMHSRWLSMALVGSFAAIAIFLCVTGVYGVIAFGVVTQQKEFGIRLALGASRSGIAVAVAGRGLALAAGGIVIGLAVAIAVARGLTSVLFGVGATDAVSFVTATAAIVIAVTIASFLPARRAASVDPATTLRAD